MLVKMNSDTKPETNGVDVKPRITSTLNPYAPSFFPSAFIDTEDFSPKWWSLVHTSPDFREYWLLEREHYVEDEQLTSEDVSELEEMVGFIDHEPFLSEDEFEESFDLIGAPGLSPGEEEQQEHQLSNVVDEV